MEVYVPILIKEGRKKIRDRHMKIKSGANSSALVEQRKEMKEEKIKMKIMDTLMVPDIDTDDSMKDIEYKDIMSDQSDDNLDPD